MSNLKEKLESLKWNELRSLSYKNLPSNQVTGMKKVELIDLLINLGKSFEELNNSENSKNSEESKSEESSLDKKEVKVVKGDLDRLKNSVNNAINNRTTFESTLPFLISMIKDKNRGSVKSNSKKRIITVTFTDKTKKVFKLL